MILNKEINHGDHGEHRVKTMGRIVWVISGKAQDCLFSVYSVLSVVSN